MKKKKRKIPGADTARAIATRLRLRVNKALKNVPAEALTPYPLEDSEAEGELLQRAYDALPKLTQDELRRRVFRDPGKPAVGDTVFIPFIGSEREEAGLDVKTTAFTIEQFRKMQEAKKGSATCTNCWGFGFMGTRRCQKCKGAGSIPNPGVQ